MPRRGLSWFPLIMATAMVVLFVLLIGVYLVQRGAWHSSVTGPGETISNSLLPSVLAEPPASTTESPPASATNAIVDLETSTWPLALYQGGISFRYPLSWSEGINEYDYLKPSGTTVFSDEILSPAMPVPEMSGYTMRYVLTITNLGSDHFQAFGGFQYDAFPEKGAVAGVPSVPVTNGFMAHSSDYAISQLIVSTFSASSGLPLRFDVIAPDKDGESELYSATSIQFQRPILYPSSWVSDCGYSSSEAEASPGALYCDLMNQPYDFYDPSSSIPQDFCALQFTVEDGISTDTRNTFSDLTGKSACQSALDIVQSELSENHAFIQRQLYGL
jgi:hypothetical protein